MSYSPIWSSALNREFSPLYFFYLKDSFSSEYLVNVFYNVALKSLWQPHVWGWKRGRKGGLLNVRRYCRPQQPLILCWLLWHGSGFGNMWFLFLFLKKRKGIHFPTSLWEETVIAQPAECVHALCTGGVKISVSWRHLLRSDKGSLFLTQAMAVCVLWNTCPTYLRKLHYKASEGLPLYRLVDICHLLLLLPPMS